MEDKNKITVLKIVVIVLMILAIPATIIYVYQERETTLPIKTEIERGVEVKDIENKFVVMKHIGFGGGGAGGLGSPEIKCKNASQFIEIVESNETVYIDFEIVDYKTWPSESSGSRLEKKYVAFIKNRAGIMSYVDIYQYAEKPDSFWSGRAFRVKNYNSDSVVFAKGNGLTFFGLLILMEVIILISGIATANKIEYDTWNIFYFIR